jgi:hypothetical protein
MDSVNQREKKPLNLSPVIVCQRSPGEVPFPELR